MQNCKVDFKVVFNFIKRKVEQDPANRDFSVIAKSILDKQGEPDDIKVVILKAVAQVYKSLSEKGTPYTIDAKANLLFDTRMQEADLKDLYKKAKAIYSPKAPSAPDTIEGLIDQVERKNIKDDFEVIDFVKTIVDNFTNILNRQSAAARFVIKNQGTLLLKKLADKIEGLPAISSRVKTLSKQHIQKIQNLLDTITQYVPLSKTQYEKIGRVFDKNGKPEMDIFFSNGKYYRLDDPTQAVDITGKTVEFTNYDRPGFVGREITQDGNFRILGKSEAFSGMRAIWSSENSLVKKLLLVAEDPSAVVEVRFSKKTQKLNKKRAARIAEQVQGRSMETFESFEQQAYMRQTGKPVATVSSPVEGGTILMSIPGSDEVAVVYDLSNYAVVYPDNRTEKIDFTDRTQWELIKTLFRTAGADGQFINLTDADLQRLSSIQSAVNEFRQKAMDYLDKQGTDEAVLPRELWEGIINLEKGGLRRTPTPGKEGPLLSAHLDKSKDQQVAVKVVKVDEEGEPTGADPEERRIPMLIQKVNKQWNFTSSTLAADERIVDDNGNLMTADEYFRKVHGAALRVQSYVPNFPFHIGYALVTVDEKSAQYVYSALNRDFGADPVKSLLRFFNALSELEKQITKSPTDVNRLMREFNQTQYTFQPYAGWYADLSAFYGDKSKSVGFNIELRPISDKDFKSYTAGNEERIKELKKATRIGLDAKSIKEISDLLNDLASSKSLNRFITEKTNGVFTSYKDFVQDGTLNPAFFDVLFEFVQGKPEETQINEAYDKLASELRRGFNQALQRLEKLAYPTVPAVQLLLENENSRLTGRNFIKIQDKTSGLESGNFDQFRLITDLQPGEIYLQAPKVTPAAPVRTAILQPNTTALAEAQGTVRTEPVATSTPDVRVDDDVVESSDDKDAPFSLVDLSEKVIAHQGNSYQSEVDYIKSILPAGFAVGDLAQILDSIKADGRILGYFKDRVIYMNEKLSGKGTGYHEAFHAVFRHLLTEVDRNFYIAKAIQSMGPVTRNDVQDFRSKRGLFHLSDASVIRRMAEEHLADRFKAYKLEKKEPQQKWLRYLMQLLDKVINFFKSKSKQIDEVTELFNRIDTGYYKNAAITGEFSEGAYELLPSRRAITGMNQEGKPVSEKDYFSSYDQQQLINRLAWETSMAPGKIFSEKYESARQKLLGEYDVETLIAQNPTADPLKIRAKYTDLFADVRFVLGDTNSFYKNLTGNPAMDRKINEQMVKEAADTLKNQVQEVVKDVDIRGLFFDAEAQFTERDDEDQHYKDNYDSNYGNLNPLDGLSRQFRKFFAMLPYSYTDQDTGVKVTKMIDGGKVFYTFLKLSADVQPDMILQHLDESVQSLKEDGNTDAYEKLNTVMVALKNIFGLDENYQPTRNFNFHNQFLNTFYVTEVSTLVYRIRTSQNGNSRFEVYDATIQRDIFEETEKLKRSYTREYLNKSDKDRKAIFDEVKAAIARELPKTGDLGTSQKDTLIKKAKAIKAALDKMGLHFSQTFLEFSLVNIDLARNPDKVFTSTSRAGKLLAMNPVLSSQGSYLQEDFFRWVASDTLGYTTNIFEKTDIDTIEPEDLEEQDRIRIERTPEQNKQIEGFHSILRKAARFMVKYNVDANVSMYQNAEGENVYRYLKNTPLLQFNAIIRQKGLQGLVEEYPQFEEWFNDNPFFNENGKDKEIDLYLRNFGMSMFGGTRQTLGNKEREGATFKNTDPRSKFIADLAMFANRDVIRRNKTQIVTYNRSYSILEGTSTNFMIPVLYQNLFSKDGYTLDKTGTPVVVSTMLQQIGQEYNRIAREWSTREERNREGHKDNYLDYNARKDASGKLDTESPSLRAYNFNRLARFFGKNNAGLTTYVHPNTETAGKRSNLRDSLIELAKTGVPFSDVIKGKSAVDLAELKAELQNYLAEEFDGFLGSLEGYGVITREGDEQSVSSSLLPDAVKTGIAPRQSLTEAGYANLEQMLADYFMNDFNSKLFVNQFYDADLAVNVKNATNYAMRNKFGVISGDSMRSGYHTVAYVDELTVWINVNDITAGQYDTFEEIPEALRNQPGWKQEKVFDGQSVTTLEHRIDMYVKQGRLEETRSTNDDEETYDVKSLLQKARLEPLTKPEIKYLENAKIVLGSYKTATGGLNEFHKLSEHILLRTDVSYIVPVERMTVKQTIDQFLKPLMLQADYYRQLINEGKEYVVIEGRNVSPRTELRDLYEDIHQFFAPLPGQETLHHLLNSMEVHGIDQLMDPNSSKRGTLIPTTLKRDGYTDLSVSAKPVLNKYKYMQVETSGVKSRVTVPTQKRQLIDADIALDSPNVPVELKDAVKQYRRTLQESSQLSLDQVRTILDTADGEVNITPVIKTMRLALERQGASANDLKLFELDTNGQPKHNVNLPMLKTLFKNYFFAFYSANLFSESSAGRKDFLVTSFGRKLVVDENDKVIPQTEVKKNPAKYAGYKTRYPGIRKSKDKDGNEIYVVEVIIPEPMFKNEQHRKLFMEKLNQWIATRIPTEDKRSMIVAEAVDFVDSAYQNIMIVPQAYHLLAGSDLDIDTLFSQVLATYEGIDGKEHLYGDYSGYSLTEPEAMFAEYLVNKSQDQNLEGEITEEFNRIVAEEGSVEDLPEAFDTLLDYMGLSQMQLSKENFKQRIAELKEIRQSYYQSYVSMKDARQKVFDEYVTLRTENEAIVNGIREQYMLAMGNFDETNPQMVEQVNQAVKARLLSARLAGETEGMPDFKKQGEYSARLRYYQESSQKTFEAMTGSAGEIAEAKAAMRKFDQFMKLIATLNVLSRFNMPTSIPEVMHGWKVTRTGTMKSKTPSVKEVIQNQNVREQIKILGNPYVFDNLYKNERSDTSFFKKLTSSQDKSINSVVDKFDINSPAWVVNMLNMSSESDDAIGVSASQNKVAAFLTKYNVSLLKPVWTINGVTYKDFKSFATDADGEIFRVIEKIGQSIGMSADAKKEPYTSVLNLDQQTMGTTLSMIAQGIDPTFAFNLNMIPTIAGIIKRKNTVASNTTTQDELFEAKSMESISKEVLMEKEAVIFKLKDRWSELYKMEEGKIMVDSNTGNKILRPIELSFKYDYGTKNRETLEDFGYTATYKDNGEVVAEDVLEIHLLSSYINQLGQQRDNFALLSMLSLIKKLNPDFETLDKIANDYAYLMGYHYKKPNFRNIKQVLEKEAIEFLPLLDGLDHLYKSAQKVFLERNPVFSVINKEFSGTLLSYKMTEKYKQAVNGLPVRFMMINRVKARLQESLKDEKAKPSPNAEIVKRLEGRLAMFTSDFWEGKTSDITEPISDDIDYLYDNHPGNAFVQFLKYRVSKGITFVEALSRMKLEAETTDAIIDGYNLLSRSLDSRTSEISNKLLAYLLVKDNLGFSNNSYLRYVNPDKMVEISKDLTILQQALNKAIGSKAARKLITNGTVFKEYLNNPEAGLVNLSITILKKGLTSAQNADFFLRTKLFTPGGKKSRLGNIKDTKTLMFFVNTILPNTAKLDWRDVYGVEKVNTKEEGEQKNLRVNGGQIDLLVPTTNELDKGIVTIDLTEVSDKMGEVQSTVLDTLKIAPEYDVDPKGIETFIGFKFPMTMINSQGQLLVLDTLDSVPLGEHMAKQITQSLEKGYSIKRPLAAGVTGKYAKYRVSAFEGTLGTSESISNVGFTTEDARSLYDFVQKNERYSYITSTKEFDSFLQKMYTDFGVPVASLEKLKTWVKTDVYRKGSIKFGKEGKFTMRYKVPGTDGFYEEFAIELTPASTTDGLSVKATQYRVVDGLKKELYSKEFKAVEIQSLSKEQRRQARLDNLKKEGNEKMAKLFGVSVDELEQKGLLETQNNHQKVVSGSPETQKLYDDLIKRIDELKSQEEAGAFYQEVIINSKGEAVRGLTDEQYNKLTPYFMDRMQRGFDNAPAAPVAPAPQIKVNITEEKKEAPQVIPFGTMRLKNGVIYRHAAINSKMLEEMGYTPEQIGEILKKIC